MATYHHYRPYITVNPSEMPRLIELFQTLTSLATWPEIGIEEVTNQGSAWVRVYFSRREDSSDPDDSYLDPALRLIREIDENADLDWQYD